jgi:hypothetical protein
MSNEPRNHGEGNPEAAENFNDAEQEFVRSARGRKRIQEGPKVRPEEEVELAEAERAGRDRKRDSNNASSS